MDDVLQHLDAVLHGHGTAQLHVPRICTPPRAGGCQLVHRPQLTFCVCPPLLFWWVGFPLAWSPLRLQRALEQLVRQLLPGFLVSASYAPPVSRPQRAYVQSIHQEQRELEWERRTRPTLRMTSVDVAC